MIKNKILAIIPARGGSKGVPRKNIRKINNIPLIGYTINAALKSKKITDIVVSTDSTEIAEISKEFGAYVPFIRPKELALDKTESFIVVKHALDFMEKEKNIKYDSVLMLQPTSPLRTSIHIDESIELLKSKEYDSVISLVSIDGNHPLKMKRLVNGELVNYIDQGDFWCMQPRQILPDVYIGNGAIYLINRNTLLDNKQLIGKKCAGYIMDSHESVNIDTPIDLEIAKLLLEKE